jgi:hypothetical protein
MTTRDRWRRLEINGGQVTAVGDGRYQFQLPAGVNGYADAQIDDYGGRARRHYPWQPGVDLRLTARFSHDNGALQGTAGFGFWNAPFGDPTVPWPALPQAAWFFYGSPPTDLPLAAEGPGRGWFAATLDAGRWPALALTPLALPVLLLNQVGRWRRRIWPWVQRRLAISFQPLTAPMSEWGHYRLQWRPDGCAFWVDGQIVHQTSHSPRGPLGFVCWLDNQAMVATANGRFRWQTLPLPEAQWLEVADLEIQLLGRS